MESYYTPRNKTNRPYQCSSKENEILVFKKEHNSHKLVSAWQGYNCETIHSTGFMISVGGSDTPEVSSWETQLMLRCFFLARVGY